MSNFDGLQRLIYLCQIKNDLNRKRRRFYYYWNPPKKWDGSKYVSSDKPKHISKSEARKGYCKAQKDMKAMTQEMRKMRVEMGVGFVWTDHGAIGAIELGSGKRLNQKQFKKFYEAEVFEMELFGG